MNHTPHRSRKNRLKKHNRSHPQTQPHQRPRGGGAIPHTRLAESERRNRNSEPMAPMEMEGAFDVLIPEIKHALAATGYTTPTPIQAKAIPPLLEGSDLLGSAQTGTGKTAAFTLPLLQKLSAGGVRTDSRRPRALILAPTRELAAQIGESIATYGRFLHVTHTVIFGGVGQFPQERAMNRGVDIVVATPGRLLDLMNQGFVKLDAVETFILDEADRMLDMGFIPDIKRILAKLPTDRQTAFFSATLGPEIVSLARGMLVDPVRVTIDPERPTVDKIRQRVLFVNREDKDKLLISILNEPGVGQAIVFAQMKHMANRVCERLQRSGISAAPIHGNRSQAARTRALNGFRNGEVKVLVATDIASRGIDVDDISHVINYDLPSEPETYVHRIGRTARAGSDGHAWSLCTAQERGLLRAIERLIKQSVPPHMEHEYHSHQAFEAGDSPARPVRGGGGGRRNGVKAFRAAGPRRVGRGNGTGGNRGRR